jgi:transposase
VTLHSLTDGQGMPLALCCTPANGSEPGQVIPLLDQIQIPSDGRPGRPRQRPARLQADAGYDTRTLRRALQRRGIQAEIVVNRRGRKKPKRGRPCAKPVDRWKVERTFSWYQRKFRRLVVRWERRMCYWKGFLGWAFSLVWLKRLLLVG